MRFTSLNPSYFFLGAQIRNSLGILINILLVLHLPNQLQYYAPQSTLILYQIMSCSFKSKYSLAERKQKCSEWQAKHPNKLNIIVQKSQKSKLPVLDRSRFACDKHSKFGNIRNQILDKITKSVAKTTATGSFFLMIDNKIPSFQQTLEELFNEHREEDGFLYMIYQEMESF